MLKTSASMYLGYHIPLRYLPLTGRRSLQAMASALFLHLPIVPAVATVSIGVEGDIAPACQITASGGDVYLGDLSGGGSKSLEFSLICNAPFAYRLESASGGLKHTTLSSSPAVLSTLLPYVVGSHIPTENGEISDTCSSTTIQKGFITCHFSDSGTEIAPLSFGRLTFTWDGESHLLQAGAYEDCLTIVVETRL
jgi:hypothetical protein